jgi:hypothetical protein
MKHKIIYGILTLALFSLFMLSGCTTSTQCNSGITRCTSDTTIQSCVNGKWAPITNCLSDKPYCIGNICKSDPYANAQTCPESEAQHPSGDVSHDVYVDSVKSQCQGKTIRWVISNNYCMGYCI